MAKVLITEDYLSDIGDAIRGKLNVSSHYTPGQMASAIGRIPVVSPTLISKMISSNGTYNASEDEADGYDTVSVDVPNSYSAADEGKVVVSGALSIQGALSVYSNSIYDTTLFSQVSVEVPQPVLVSKTVSENGTYNPVDDSADAYSQVVVNVSSGGGGLPDFVLDGSGGSLFNSTLQTVRSYAFMSHSGITDVEMTNVLSINNSAFYRCGNLKTASFPECIVIGTSAFASCSKLQSVTFSEAQNIMSYAFWKCTSITIADFPECISVGSNAFDTCSNIVEVKFDKCTDIYSGAFSNCLRLVSVSFPLCTQVQSYAFYCCLSLKDIYMPNLVSISSYAFMGCRNIESLELNNCEVISDAAFSVCTSMSFITLNKCSAIRNAAFYGCTKLESIYLLSNSICTLSNSNAFTNTPITKSSYLGYFGSIYVLSELADTYKVANVWSYFADRITSYVEE